MDHVRPSRVRYLVVAVTMLTAVLLYLDRICISIAERFIKEDLQLTNRQMSWVLSVFFVAYGLGQVPSGWLSDRFGARRMLTAYVLLWSLFTGLTGLATGFVSLVAIRLIFGVAQAGAYPTSAGLLSKWVPFPARGAASSLVAFGGRLGGFLAPLATGYLIVFFVPIGVSSLLEPDDVLDLGELCRQLTSGDNSAAAQLGRRILDETPADTRALVERVATEHGATGGSAAPEADPPRDSPRVGRNDDSARVVAALNDLLRRRDAFEPFDLPNVLLPDEAERILALPPSDRSQPQVERLNRLLLEAVYPGAIRRVYVAGWRQVMLAFGSVGLVVAAVYWFCCRDRPAEHPRANAAEIALVEAGRPAAATSPHGLVQGLPFRCLLQSRSLWLSCLSQFGTNMGWVFLITWLPRYLAEVHHVPLERRSDMASVPLFVGWFGMLSGGWLTDRLTRLVGLRWGRALPMGLSRFVAMAAFLFCLLPVSPWTATAAFALVALATDVGTPSVWAFKQDVGGRYVGSILGWGNMWGNFGAALSPHLLDGLVERWQNWDAAFLACAAAFFISGLAALGVNATIPVVPQENSQPSRA